MTKTFILVACLTAVLTPCSALSASERSSNLTASFQDRHRHNWTLTTSYVGKITVLDPAGHLVRTVYNSPLMQRGANPADAPFAAPVVTVQTDGVNTSVAGLGSHRVTDLKGHAVGSIVIAPLTAADIRQIKAKEATEIQPADFNAAVVWGEKRLPTTGVSSGDGWAAGREQKPALFWFVRGTGWVKVTNANGRMLSAAQVNPPLTSDPSAQLSGARSATPASAVPRLAVLVNGRIMQASGYGRHTFRNAQHHPLITIEFYSRSL